MPSFFLPASNPEAQPDASSTYTLPARGMWDGDWATDAKLKLVSDSYINFISVPRILDFARREALGGQDSEEPSGLEVIQYAHKISRLYRKRLGEYITAAEQAGASAQQDPAIFQQTRDIPHAQELRSILHLAETFYIPADGLGDGVVGEALVHWLTHSRPGPPSEIAEDFMSAATPYYNPEFLPYINKCILRGQFGIAATLLTKFEDHHPIVRQLAAETAELIAAIPRSPSFTDARKFLLERHEWTERVKVLQSALQSELDEFEADRAREGDESDGGDERLDLEVGFMILLGTLAGDDQRILDASESWQEALAAWGLLVQPSMTRDDAPLVLPSILKQCGVTDDPADQVQAALVRGEPAEAARLSREVDPWLAAHLIDLFDRAGILAPIDDADTTAEAITKLRYDATMAYAEMILEDQGLWRVAIDYFALAGPAGEARLREVLLSVPLTEAEEEAMGGSYGKGKGKGKDRAKLQGQSLQNKIRDTTLAHQKTMKRIRALNASATGGTVWGGAEDVVEEEDDLGDDDDELETSSHTTFDPNVLAARRERKRRRLQRERELAARSIEVQRVEDVLEVCQEHGLLLEARAVCLKMADAMLHQKKYSVALEYGARARDERLVGRIADFLIDQYIFLEPAAWLQLINQIPASLLRGNAVAPGPPGAPEDVGDHDSWLDEDEGRYGADEDYEMDLTGDGRSRKLRRERPAFGQGEPVDSPRLQFLAKYRDFHRACAAGQLAVAASILVEVLSGRLAPYRFWALILLDAANIPEKSPRPCFDAEQTFELMRCLEQICSGARRNQIEAKRYFGLLSTLLNPSGQGQAGQPSPLQTDRLVILQAPEVDVEASIQRMNVIRHLLAQQLSRNTT